MIKNKRILIFFALLIVTLLIMWSIFLSQQKTNNKIVPTPAIKLSPTVTVTPKVTKSVNDANVGSLPESIAPDIELNDLKGRVVKLSDYKGKMVILSFWKTWDKQSLSWLSVLNYVNKELLPEDNTIILTVNDESRATVEKFLEKNKYDINVLIDKEQKAFNAYNIDRVPTTYIIDKDGIIKEIYTAEMTKGVVFTLINKYGTLHESGLSDS